MKKWTFVLLIPVFFACKSMKTAKLMKQGEVAQKEFKAEVPFEFRLGLIILKVKIEGETYDFVLDTGAPNLISKELAEKLKIKDAISQKALDSQGQKSDIGFTTVKDIEIGGVHFTNTGAAIADLKQSSAIGCLKVDGFIGANLMRKAFWRFDYQKQLITILHASDAQNFPGMAKVIPFRQKLTGTPIIDVDYNGIIDKNVTFDMGANGDFSSSTKVWNELSKQNKITQKTYGFGQNDAGLFGQGARDTVYFGIIPEVRLGDIVTTNQVVSFSEKKGRCVGTQFFNNYILMLDWEKEEITMVPVEPYQFSELKSYGLLPSFSDGKLNVGFLYAQSDAEKQGISVGDQILEINGYNYRNCTPDMWCTIIDNGLFTKDSHTISILVLRGDQEKLLTLNKNSLLKVAE